MSENTTVTEDPGAAAGDAETQPQGWVEERLGSAVEAILLSLDKPISAAKLGEALGVSPGAGEGAKGRRKRGGGDEVPESVSDAIDRAVAELNAAYDRTGRSFRIEKVAGGYRIMTRPEFAPVLAAFHKARGGNRLGKAAVETLSIIAYKQPITRAHLEAIRGVGCGEILRSLLERRLITIKGRAEELGRPMLYGTTKEFLDAFGLATLKDLPTASDLQGSP